MGIFSNIFGNSADSINNKELPYIHRSSLDANGRDAYDRIRQGLMSGYDTISLSGLCRDAALQAGEVWKLVIMDEPRILRSNGKASVTSIGGVPSEITIGTLFSFAEEKRRLRDIDATIRAMLDEIKRQDNDKKKAEIAYRSIIECTDYGIDEDGNQSMDSVFLDRFSCCAGYSHAFQYVMELSGIPCAYIDGYTHGEKKTGAHAWNLAVLDGKRCWIDVTWGDPVLGGVQASIMNMPMASRSDSQIHNIRMDYLCIPDSDLRKTHNVAPSISSLVGNVDDGDYDWYEIRGMKFHGAYDRVAVAKAIQSDLLGREILSEDDIIANIDIKFMNDGAYSDALNDLFYDHGLYNIVIPVLSAYGISIKGNVNLSENREINVLHFFFNKSR